MEISTETMASLAIRKTTLVESLDRECRRHYVYSHRPRRIVWEVRHSRWRDVAAHEFSRPPRDLALAEEYIRRCRQHRKNSSRAARFLPNDFHHMVNEWRRDTALQSNPAIKTLHPSYLRIIAYGKPAAVWMLREFARGELDDWFTALE